MNAAEAVTQSKRLNDKVVRYSTPSCTVDVPTAYIGLDEHASHVRVSLRDTVDNDATISLQGAVMYYASPYVIVSAGGLLCTCHGTYSIGSRVVVNVYFGKPSIKRKRGTRGSIV